MVVRTLCLYLIFSLICLELEILKWELTNAIYSLLDPLSNDRFDEVRHQYASLLFRWRMFSKAAEVMKYSETAPYSAPLRGKFLNLC